MRIVPIFLATVVIGNLVVRNTQPHFLVILVPIVVVSFNFLSTVTIEYHVLIIRLHSYGNRIKSPRKKTPEKISLNAVEREPVETRVETKTT